MAHEINAEETPVVELARVVFKAPESQKQDVIVGSVLGISYHKKEIWVIPIEPDFSGLTKIDRQTIVKYEILEPVGYRE